MNGHSGHELVVALPYACFDMAFSESRQNALHGQPSPCLRGNIIPPAFSSSISIIIAIPIMGILFYSFRTEHQANSNGNWGLPLPPWTAAHSKLPVYAVNWIDMDVAAASSWGVWYAKN